LSSSLLFSSSEKIINFHKLFICQNNHLLFVEWFCEFVISSFQLNLQHSLIFSPGKSAFTSFRLQFYLIVLKASLSFLFLRNAELSKPSIKVSESIHKKHLILKNYKSTNRFIIRFSIDWYIGILPSKPNQYLKF
jgi:hypothetical protein